MDFVMPTYTAPDFTRPEFLSAPDAAFETVEKDGVAPENFHSTSMYPEYVKLEGRWRLAEESRMDSCIVWNRDGSLSVVESRNLKKGDRVIVGRSEDGREGIYLHSSGFGDEPSGQGDQFVFRQGRSRETSYARDYDRLIRLLRYEKEHGGKVIWVMGPAFSFDADARRAMEGMIDNGYVQGILAGNALAVHDLEGALFHTALGQDIYTQIPQPQGHYNHLDVINKVRSCGSIHVYEGASAMRSLIREGTTLICLATMLHTIAAGNMTPSFRLLPDGSVRPLFIYTVDADEFVVNKLLDRGSLSATSIVTNVQDFITIVARGLGVMEYTV